MDEQNPSIKVIIHGQEIEGTIVDGGPRVNVINKATCDKLDITKWGACPFWIRMDAASTVRPLGLIKQLNVILRGHDENKARNIARPQPSLRSLC